MVDAKTPRRRPLREREGTPSRERGGKAANGDDDDARQERGDSERRRAAWRRPCGSEDMSRQGQRVHRCAVPAAAPAMARVEHTPLGPKRTKRKCDTATTTTATTTYTRELPRRTFPQIANPEPNWRNQASPLSSASPQRGRICTNG